MRGKLLNAFTQAQNWSVTSRLDKSTGLYAQARPAKKSRSSVTIPRVKS